MGGDQIWKNRDAQERLPYHDVYAESLKIINGLYAQAATAGSDSLQRRNAKEIEIRNWIAAKVIQNQKRRYSSIEDIAKEAAKIKDKDDYLRFAMMYDEMAKAKLVPVDLKRFTVDTEAPKELQPHDTP